MARGQAGAAGAAGRTRIRPAPAAVFIFVMAAFARTSDASSFAVNPTQLVLNAKTSSALLTLRNDSDETLRFQLSVFAWDQSTDGQLKLDKTEDIVFFPPLLTLAPKESRNIRIATVTPVGAAERTYRLFVEELPSHDASEKTGAVRVLTKMGVPIFLQPVKLQAEASLRDLALKDGLFTFNVRNTGNVHFMTRAVRVRATDQAGATVFDEQVDGWYILSGGLRAYQLRVPAPQCASIAALSVEVQIDSSALRERLETPVPACAP
jgi:fimbrial chaperone protein